MSIIGEHGFAVLGGWATDKLIEYSPDPSETTVHSQSNTDAYGQGHMNIYQCVNDTIRGLGDPAVTADDARRVLHLRIRCA